MWGPGGAPQQADFHYVTAVDVVPGTAATTGMTQITWDDSLSAGFQSALAGGADSTAVSLYTFARKAALYGVQAPNPETLPATSIANVNGKPTGSYLGATWDYGALYQSGSSQINVDASYSGLTPASTGPPKWIVLAGTSHDYRSVFSIQSAVDTNPNFFTLTTKTTQLTLQLLQILTGDIALTQDEVIKKFVEETPAISAYIQSAALSPADLPLTSWAGDATYNRQPGMLAPVSGTTISVVGGQQIAAGQPIGVFGMRLRLQVPQDQTATFVPAGFSTGSQAAGGQVFVIDAFPPASDPANPENLLWTVHTLSGVAGSLSVPPATTVQLQPSDPKVDTAVGEAALVQSATVDGDMTELTLAVALSGIYDASTLTVNANAVQATNGETVQEILGSGDAATDPLQFTLKQAPLTYVTAASGSGAQSTLQVWVNNLQWTEAPNLLSSRAGRPRLRHRGQRGRQPGGDVRRRRPGRPAPDRHLEHPGHLPQGHRQRRNGGRGAAHPAAGPAPGPLLGHQSEPGVGRRRSGHRRSGSRQHAAAGADDRPGGLASGLPELRPRVRRHRQGAGLVDVVRRSPRRDADRSRGRWRDAVGR